MRKMYWLGSLMAIIIVSFCIKGTAHSMERTDAMVEGYFRQMESEYSTSIRALVNEMGYENAGVMLTKIVDEDGFRDYTLSIHHRRIGNDPVKDSALIDKINEIDFSVDNSSIYIMISN